jgi:hypothetical protein
MRLDLYQHAITMHCRPNPTARQPDRFVGFVWNNHSATAAADANRTGHQTHTSGEANAALTSAHDEPGLDQLVYVPIELFG